MVGLCDMSYVLDQPFKIQIPDQCMRKQYGVHLFGIQIVGLSDIMTFVIFKVLDVKHFCRFSALGMDTLKCLCNIDLNIGKRTCQKQIS